MSADLIRQIRKRPTSERRWEAWYKSAYPKVYFAAYRLAAGNADLARDFTQETFTRFLEYRAIERVESERHAVAYLIKTCRNLAIDRNAHAREISLEDLVGLESVAAPEQPMGQALDFERALRELNANDLALGTWIHEGLSVSEIAEKLGTTYTAAGVRVHRLKKRLREMLG